VGEGDADAIDATVGRGEDFEAETVFLDDLAAHGDVASNLGDESAEGGGLVVLGEAEGGGVVCIAVRVAVEEIFAGGRAFGVETQV